MSGKQNRNRDPAKRAAKRRQKREAASRSTTTDQPSRQSGSQATHASSGRARKKARHGERLMETERRQAAAGHDEIEEDMDEVLASGGPASAGQGAAADVAAWRPALDR